MALTPFKSEKNITVSKKDDKFVLTHTTVYVVEGSEQALKDRLSVLRTGKADLLSQVAKMDDEISKIEEALS